MDKDDDLPEDSTQAPVVPTKANHSQESEDGVDDRVDPGQDDPGEGVADGNQDGQDHANDDGAGAQKVAALAQGAVDGPLQAHIVVWIWPIFRSYYS